MMVGKIEKKTMRNNQMPLLSFSLYCCVLMDIVHDRVIRTAFATKNGGNRPKKLDIEPYVGKEGGFLSMRWEESDCMQGSLEKQKGTNG